MDNNVVVNFTIGGLKEASNDISNTAKSMTEFNKVTATATDEMTAFTQSIDLANKKLSTLEPNSKEWKDLNNEIKASKLAFESLATDTASLKKEFANTRNEIVATEKALNKLRTEGLANTQQANNLKQKLQELKQKGGELKDQIGDLNSELNVLGSDTRGIDTVIQGIQGIVAGFEVGAGAVALFGEKNKDLEQALIKLNGVMAIANGLQQIQQLTQKETAISTGVMSAAQSAYTFVVEGSTIAVRAFRAALLSIGIGAIVAGVYALYEAFKSLTSGTYGATKATAEYAATSEQSLNASKARAKAVKEEEEYLKALGNTEAQIAARQRDAQREVYKNAVANRDALRQQLQEQQNTLKAYQSGGLANPISPILGFITDKNVQTTKQKLAEANAEVVKAGQEFVVLIKKASDLQIEQEKTTTKKIKEEHAERKRSQEKLIEANIKTTQEEQEKLRFETKKGSELIQADRDEDNRKRIEKEKKVQEESLNLLTSSINGFFDLKSQSIQNTEQEELESLQRQKEADVRLKRGTEFDKEAIEKEYRAREAQIKLRAWKAEQEAKKQQAIINGALAVTNIMATSPFFTWIFAIPAAIAATAIQVAKISSAKPPKFAEGGSVAKRLGYIDGKPHSAGGEVIEVEGNEFVMRKEAVNKYGIPFMEKINNMEMPKPSQPKQLKFDYNKMGEAIADKLQANPMLRINIDKRGVSVHKGGYELKNNYISL